MLLRKLVVAEVFLGHKVITRAKSSWDIVAGVCIERLPVVTPPLNEIQKKFKDLLWTIEIEKSLKSDHELRHESDKVQAELLKNEAVDVDLDTVSKITAQDFEDASTDELNQFKFADTITEADKKGIKSTPERCLQRHLVLVTNQKLGNDVKTILPQGLWREGETLRQTAERVLSERCGPGLKVKFLSNAPCGFYKYKYPAEINGKSGAKVFFYYANYNDGEVDKKSKPNWLTRNELTEILPEKYNKTVQGFLIEETY
ncbi:large ribosomal subunit protein mL46 [Maniola hyperantus]|uniref:large ribosomal subunit protein mL46 n=1 Tax=Aphantopus hyperantus TaxID=2795564 RepID=UPI001569A3CB|nr:39S ribosomal protein L46, mitochondrial [Maniola hyperantus]